jgi:hypothetical protein
VDKELQEYYEERFSMTGSKGWEQLQEDVDRMIAAVADIRNIGANTSVEFRKGQLDILLWLKNLRDQAKQAYDELTNESV